MDKEDEVASVPPKRGWLFRITSSVDTAMRTLFFRLGWFIALNPIKVIAAAILLMCLCLIGMLRFRTESRASELWVPQGTIALQNQEHVNANYGRTSRTSSILYRARDLRTGLATKAAFLEMLDVAEKGFDITANYVNTADNTEGSIGWESRCLRTKDNLGNELCRTISAFNLFYDVEKIVKRADGKVNFFATVRVKINEMSNEEIANRINDPNAVGFDGSVFNKEELVGTAQGSDTIEVLRYIQLARNLAEAIDGELVDDAADALEEAWTKFLLNEIDRPRNEVQWFVESSFSQDDSLSQALTGDLPLLSAGFVLLGVYVVLFLGDFHSVRSHMLLALGALVTTGVALGACFGLSSAFGMFFGPVHQILPLLIIGIGIDDCFHITRSADEVNSRPDASAKSVHAKVALALSHSGSAITVTSFTNVVVFLLSAISRLPALRFFALWAAIGIFFAWVFAATLFTAFVSLDMRRIDAKRRDCCPCMRPVQEVKELNWFKKPAGGFSRFFGKRFGPFIMHPVVRIIFLFLFAAGLGACIYGTTQLYLKFRFAFFYPAGSAQREYQDVIDEYFQLGDPTNVYIRNRNIAIQENQRKMLALCKPETGSIAQNQWIQGDTVDCWLHSLRELNGKTDDNDLFEPSDLISKVVEFRDSGPGARYSTDIVLNEEKTAIISTRFSATYVYRKTNTDEIDALMSVRKTADDANFGDEDGIPAAFPYVFFDTFTEQYEALPGEIGLSLGLASVAVGFVCLLLVGHPVVAAISVLVVGIIIIDVLGLTYFSDINLNSVSVITLVLCTGIAVDFVVHITRSFLDQVGTRTERAIKALEKMAPPVFYAGFSTFLAIIILSLAKSYIFQVIFQGFLFLVIVAFLHGLILGPLLLSLVGPPSFYDSEEDKERAEAELEQKAAGTRAMATEEPTEDMEMAEA